MQHNQPILIISVAALMIYISRELLFLLAATNFSATSIVIIFSIALAAGVGFVFFLRHDSQSRTRKFRVQYPSPVSAKPTAKPGARTRPVIEVMSAIVIILMIIGMVVGTFFPGKLTGAILPLALFLWFVLYKWMVHNKYNY